MEDEIDLSNIEFHEELGEGGFGTVNRVTFKKPYKGFTEAAAKSIWSLRQEEVEIMRKLNHPHIVVFLAFYINGPVNMILLEYARNGSVHDYLSDKSKLLPDDLKHKWIKESALAIEYLHGHNVLHRDIKTKNCLLFEGNILKLCDFGLAREIERSQTTSSQQGTCRYMAPEIHKGNERGRAVYSKQADIYAYGMLIFEICSRKPPFDGMEWQTIVLNVGRGTQPTIPSDCPQQLSEIMQSCWDIDFKKRPTIESILQVLSGQKSLKQTVSQEQSEPLGNEGEGARQPLKDIHPTFQGESLEALKVACCQNGDILFVGRAPASTDEQLYKLGRDGECVVILITPENQKVKVFRDVAVSPQGDISVVDETRDVKVFDKTGKYLHCFSTLTSSNDPSTQVNLQCIAIYKGKHVLVGDMQRKVVTIHAFPTGKLAKRIKFNICRGNICVNSKGQILYHFRPTDSPNTTKVVAIDYSGNEIFAFTPMMAEEVTDTSMVEGSGITCDTHDNIYIAICVKEGSNAGVGHIYKYNPNGEFLQCISKGLYDPRNLVCTPEGSLLVANVRSILLYNLR